MMRTSPPFRADQVGSLLRSAPIKDARARHEKGEIDDAQLERAITDLARAVQIVGHVTLVLVVDPEHLVLPVGGIEIVEVVEKGDLPARCGGLAAGVDGLQADMGTGGQQQGRSGDKRGEFHIEFRLTFLFRSIPPPEPRPHNRVV